MESLVCYLCDLAKAGGVDGSVLWNGDCVPALILRLANPAASWRVGAPPPHVAPHPASRFLSGHELLLDLDLLPVLLHLRLFVDLVDGFGALVSSAGHPVILEGRKCKRSVFIWAVEALLKQTLVSRFLPFEDPRHLVTWSEFLKTSFSPWWSCPSGWNTDPYEAETDRKRAST